jgi:hypothetical protein
VECWNTGYGKRKPADSTKKYWIYILNVQTKHCMDFVVVLDKILIPEDEYEYEKYQIRSHA